MAGKEIEYTFNESTQRAINLISFTTFIDIPKITTTLKKYRQLIKQTIKEKCINTDEKYKNSCFFGISIAGLKNRTEEDIGTFTIVAALKVWINLNGKKVPNFKNDSFFTRPAGYFAISSGLLADNDDINLNSNIYINGMLVIPGKSMLKDFFLDANKHVGKEAEYFKYHFNITTVRRISFSVINLEHKTLSYENTKDCSNKIENPATKIVFDTSMTIQMLIKDEYKLGLIDAKTNSEYGNICYSTRNQTFTATETMSGIKDNDQLEEKIITQFDIIKENDKDYKKFYFNSDFTFEQIKNQLKNERMLENGASVYKYPMFEGCDFYYLKDNNLTKLPPEGTIKGMLNIKNNMIYVKFPIQVISEVVTHYDAMVFGSENVASAIKRMLRIGNNFPLFAYKTVCHQNNAEEIFESRIEFKTIKTEETFEQAKIHLFPLIHVSQELQYA